MDKVKEMLRNAVRLLPRKMRYSVRSSMGLYELHQHPELNLIDFHKGSRVIFDVGAHEGGFTGDLLLRAPLSRVHCFEPNPGVFPILEKNCKSYGMLDNRPRAIANNIALGSTTESKEFLVTKNSACSSFFNSSSHNKEWAGEFCELDKKVIVQSNTLADYAANHQIEDAKLLKIDTQGFELEVIKGAQGLLPKVEYIYSEVQFLPLYLDAPIWTDIIHYLWDQQFFPLVMGGFCFSKNAEPLQADILFKNARS